jgi:transposase-like protein
MLEIDIQMQKRKKLVGKRWGMDETDIKLKDSWQIDIL